MADPLAPFVEDIEREYRRLGHALGWRFLYTPARTLAPGTLLAFVALNPGDSVYHPPMPSVEGGNGYRIEQWWGARQQNGLQVQIRQLYDVLAERDAGLPAEELMDQTLALNFCPFRSPNWKQLVSPKESIEFSQRMWARVLEIVDPAVIVCLGSAVLRYLDPVLRARGGGLTDPEERNKVGWGAVTYAIRRYATPSGTVTMVGLPHLSRYRIFGRPESRRATDEIAAVISSALQINNRAPTAIDVALLQPPAEQS